jgi:hypothetical protein
VTAIAGSEEAPLQARITSIAALLASGVLASKRPIAVVPEFATGGGGRANGGWRRHAPSYSPAGGHSGHRTPRLAATLKEGAAAEDDTWRDFALVAPAVQCNGTLIAGAPAA